jgi:predicted transcriptional regulator
MHATLRAVVVNARLDEESVARLDALAAAMRRTRSYLIAQAVSEFVEREYAFLCGVREGEADLDAGRYVTHEDARDWFMDLKAGRTPPLPDPKSARKK